ncbi:MAG: preprotein translocase subunit SecE [Mariprofundaceae bacterium]
MSIATVSRFFSEVRTEARKVIWPDRKETVQATLMVVVMVLLLSLFLWLVDSSFSALVQMVI